MGDVGVRFRDCECPGTPHAEEGDIVFLREALNYQGGIAAVIGLRHAGQTIKPDADGNYDALEIAQLMVPIYMEHGALGWNVLDDEGEPVPFVVQDFIDNTPFEQMLPVGAQADDLYGARVLNPFQTPSPKSSRNGRTGSTSTSAAPKSGSKRQAPRGPSSPESSAASLPSMP
jgi:hypothetical protein